MNQIFSHRLLPQLIKVIENEKAEGMLVCNQNNQNFIHLMFHEGCLTYICGGIREATSEKLLSELLTWDQYTLEWHKLPLLISYKNIEDDIRNAFMVAIQILTNDGKFDKFIESILPDIAPLVEHTTNANEQNNIPEPEESKPIVPPFEAEVENTNPVKSEPEIILPIETTAKVLESAGQSILPPSVSATHNNQVLEIPQQPSYPYQLLKTSLLLPEGQHQNQLDELLSNLSLQEQLDSLQKFRFTGYIYYHLDSVTQVEAQQQYGLALFYDGSNLDIVYHNENEEKRLFGSLAFEKLAAFRLHPEIYKVEARVLKAYRALVSGNKPYQDLKASKANLTKIHEAFKQSHQDGVALLYFDSLKLYYFFFYEGGAQIGIYGPEPNTGKLQLLTGALAVPPSDSKALITVMLATPAGKTKPESAAKLNPAQPSSEDIGTIISRQLDASKSNLPEISGAVDWGDLFSKVKDPTVSTEARRE
ncbi:MAG: hypothetical protein HXX08_06610 [Chloroflexi bacterium]|uniref:Uncharacterized protein n=1 Tax=Candidatus Chlorohelix allophototropha TaxID=3003348 RepID=A0A8T7M1I6_9CHLR|nr:hypothetical protein [Chloroflexota bacterium]WJW67404.1 hypothetical protein OZ401_000670 [Chloroflexota bacterium L227-S17]